MPVYSAELLQSREQAISKATATPEKSGQPKEQKPAKAQRLACIANRAQRGLDLPAIEEGVLGGEEEETIRAEKGGLYRPKPVGQRQIHSRDNSMARKNRELLQNNVGAPQ
jgi:hypothetical protein